MSVQESDPGRGTAVAEAPARPQVEADSSTTARRVEGKFNLKDTAVVAETAEGAQTPRANAIFSSEAPAPQATVRGIEQTRPDKRGAADRAPQASAAVRRGRPSR